MVASAAMSSKDDMKVGKSIDLKLVGVKDAALEVTELLTRGVRTRKIVSIVGMPGLGKTTLASYVYEDYSINKHFHVRAWCSVSQIYRRQALLADIVSQVSGETKTRLGNLSGDDLALMLYRYLKGRRYLIVFDDIWDITVWTDLRDIFPSDDNGSRILFTTRHRDASPKDDSALYNLRLLSNEESCELLWFKVFDAKTCPPELSIISTRIALNCKGLPLAVVMVAGILKRTERTKEAWEQVAASVKSYVGGYGDHLDIVELSYNHLPVHLRPCLLYFAAFPQDTTISVSELMQIWISQGFVWGENLEERAESYLSELIDRSLVMIAKRSSSGRVKACRVHDILQDFCSITIPRETLQTSMFGEIRSLHNCCFKHYETNCGKEWDEQQAEKPGMVTLSDRLVFDRPRGSMAMLTLSHKTIDQAGPRRPLNDDSNICPHKLLKVLDLGKVRIDSSADISDIILIAKTFIHLRFLGIRPRTNKIPAELGNLLNLETLVLTGLIGFVMLPDSLWLLLRLRSVLMGHGFFDFQHVSSQLLDFYPKLYDLKSISTLSLRHRDDAENHFLRRLPNLQKLACKFVYSWNEAREICVFPELDFLNQLVSLKVFIAGMVQYPCIFRFPSNLKKLSLSNSRFPWDAMSVIMEQLPNLEVLKLRNKAFEGQQWDMEDDEMLFPKLRFLKLDSLDIEVWNAEYEPFPCLEQLVVLSCPKLQEIPSCFGNISTLQSIEMKWCSLSAMDSVQQILQVQRDFNNEDLKVSLMALT